MDGGRSLEIIYLQRPHGRTSMVLSELVFQSNCYVDSCCSGDSNSGLLPSGCEFPAATCYIPEQGGGWGMEGGGGVEVCVQPGSSQWEDRGGRS